MLNWRPVVDYELREIEFDRREIEYKQRMQQLQKESEQLKIEDEQRSIAHEQKMRQLRRARLQARCTLVQLQHQLDPTPEHTRQLRGLIAFLLEYRPFA